MRRLITLLFAFLLLTTCKNDNKKDIPKADKTGANDRDSSYNNDEDDTGINRDEGKKDTISYNWTKKEQNKFLEDCKRESGQKLTDKKLKDFCSCMLNQARKYYPTYKQMEEKSNEDADRKILMNCAEYFDEVEND